MLELCLMLHIIWIRPFALTFSHISKRNGKRRTTRCYSRFTGRTLFFISVYFDRASCVMRDYFPRSFSRWSPSSRSISIKLSTVVGVDNRMIAGRRMIVCRVGSINLNLNLSSSRERVARNPRCFFDLWPAPFNYSFTASRCCVNTRYRASFCNSVAIIQPLLCSHRHYRALRGVASITYVWIFGVWLLGRPRRAKSSVHLTTA